MISGIRGRTAVVAAVLGGAFGLSSVASIASQLAPDVQKQEVAGIRNFTRVEATVACGGATSPEALEGLAAMGFRSVVNLREDTEPGADIDAARRAASAKGLRYIHLPFNTQKPDAAVVERFVDAVVDAANQPVYIHCASGNRVGALWYIKRVLVDGWSRERAAAEAEAIGLTSQALRQFADGYLDSALK